MNKSKNQKNNANILKQKKDKKFKELEYKERFLALFNTSTDGIVLIDYETGEIVDFNIEFIKQTQRKKEELLMMKIWDLRPYEKRQIAKKKFYEIREFGEGSSMELAIERPDKSQLPIEFRSNVINIGNKRYIQSIVRDISHFKNINLALQDERDRLTNILDAIQDGIYICSKDKTVEYVNPTMMNRLGEPAGKKCYEYLYKRYEECPWCKNTEVFAGKTIKSEWYDPESRKTYDLIDTPIYNPDGSISKLKIFHDITNRKEREKVLNKDKKKLIQDITDRKEREKVLNKDKKKLIQKVDKINIELIQKTSDLEDKNSRIKQQSEIIDNLFANTQFLIALLDTNFNFIRVNKAYAVSNGRNEDFFIGKNHFDLFPHEENQMIFKNVLRTGESYLTYSKPFSYPEKSGLETTYWDWSLNPIKDEDGRIVALILILLDVTTRKNAQIKLIETNRLSDIGALATTVAHELRSPLGVIQGTVYNVMRKNKDDKLLENMRRIERKVDESENIINNLLNYSRIKHPYLKKIHLYNFTRECINDVKKQYLNKKVKLNYNYDPFKEIELNIDPFQIREVLSNVLGNAYQAVLDNEGHIEVKGFIDPPYIKIDIKDNGEGIEKDDIKQIFEPFFTKKSRGTGLGLTICRELVNLHNGNIEIESERGKGTVVHIFLPLDTPK